MADGRSKMKVTVLGSTGSIGQSTLDVIRRNRERFQVHALVAGRNVETLCAQIEEFRPSVAVIANEADLPRIRGILSERRIAEPQLAWGSKAILKSPLRRKQTPHVPIVGVAGLEATFEATGPARGSVWQTRKRGLLPAAWDGRSEAPRCASLSQWTANITGRINACAPVAAPKRPS